MGKGTMGPHWHAWNGGALKVTAPRLTGRSQRRRRPDGVDGGVGGVDGEAWTVLRHACNTPCL
jgi:hypothetical protein